MTADRHLRRRMSARRLSHAYLITGERREELARELAAAWVCTGEEPPCGACSGCRKAGLDIHPDIITLDAPGEGLKAEDVRALRSDAYIRPNEAPCKVYILRHGELLNPTGQNILLKLVEEGPGYARFLFLTPNPELLLPTIRSRCELLRAGGDAELALGEEGAVLAGYFLEGTPPLEALPFLIGLEKKSREEIALLLEETHARLAEASRQRPELLSVLDKLEPIRAACQFNISPGHLAGWIASVL